MTPELLEALLHWSAAALAREPDIVLEDFGSAYLRRWELPGSSPGHHIYLHEIVRSEHPDAMHGHPWPNASIVLAGRYIEHTPERAFIRSAGDVVYRAPGDTHRMEVSPGEPCTTLFLTGDWVEVWAEGRHAEIGDFGA